MVKPLHEMSKRERERLVTELQAQKRAQVSRAAAIRKVIEDEQRRLAEAEKRIREIDAGLNELS
ncbi:hypothetical protein [Prescottella equi]